MQGRHPKNKIVLKDEDRKNLEKIAKSRTAEVRLVQRAQIILLAAEGKYRNTEIGEKVGCNRITVRKWRRRFRESGMDGLKDMARSGHPLEFSAQERAEVLAMATRKPEDEGKHFTDWSVRELANHVVAKGIIETISPTTVFRWLREADIKPHKWEYWLNSKDPDFLKK